MKRVKTILSLTLIAAFTLAHGADLKATLTEALRDEQRSGAFYAAVMKKFGPVRPFANIVKAEAMHAKLVVDLMSTRSLEVPNDEFAQKKDESDVDFIKRMKVPATLIEACKLAAKVEKDQGPFYEAFLKQDLPEDVRTTFTKLRNDSIQKHLRAFERCSGKSN